MDQVHQALLEKIGRNGIPKEWTPTARQEALKVPPELVYICSMALLLSDENSTTTQPPYPPKATSRFQYLLKVFQEITQGPTTTTTGTTTTINKFQLSPVLVPSAEQAELIRKDTQSILQKLEKKSNEALQDLLQEHQQFITEPTKVNKNTNAKSRPRKANKKISKTTTTTTALQTQDPKPGSSEPTLTELLATQIGMENISENLQTDSWVSVGKKSAKQSPKSLPIPPATNCETDSIEENSTALGDDGIQVIETSQSDDTGTSSISNGTSYLRAAQQPPSDLASVPTTTSQLPCDSTASAEELQATIADLQNQLATKDQQLQSERLASAKSLRLQRESSENLIQALQLRLYISDTRLKTYQDALEDHLQAVATNSHYQSSPARRPTQHHEGDPPSSPLISRVLMQQNRLEGR